MTQLWGHRGDAALIWGTPIGTAWALPCGHKHPQQDGHKHPQFGHGTLVPLDTISRESLDMNMEELRSIWTLPPRVEEDANPNEGWC